MSQVRIVGVGSPLGLDRIGWEVVNALEGDGFAGRFPPGAVILSTWDRPGSRLLDLLRHSYGVVLIDAMQAGGAAGTVRRLAPDQLAAVRRGFVSSHDVGIPETLALAEALGDLPARTVIYGIEVGAQQDAVPEAPMDELCRRAVTCLEPLVAADVGQWLGP